MKIPVPSLARNGTTNWPTKCVKKDKQDIRDGEHIRLKPKNIETGRHKLFQKNMSIDETVSSVHKTFFLIDNGRTQNWLFGSHLSQFFVKIIW